MKYIDNRSMRDDNYLGPLILECEVGHSKEEALRTMINILQGDRMHYQDTIDALEKKVEYLKIKLIAIDKQLKKQIL